MKIILRWALLGFLYLVILPNYIVAQNNFYGENIIIDGNFLDAWETFQLSDEGGAATANFDASGGEAAVTGISGTDGTAFHIQVYQSLTDDQIAEIVEGGVYELSFDARTDASTKDLGVFFGHDGDGWENYASGVTLTDQNQNFNQIIVIDTKWFNDDFGMKFGFEGGTSDDSYYVDNVVLRRAEDNIIKNGEFTDITDWTVEIAGEAAANVEVVNGEMSFSGLNGLGNPWEVQVHQVFDAQQLDSLYEGNYELSFDARTDTASKDIHVFLGQIGGDWVRWWQNPGDGIITITDNPQNYKLYFAATPETIWSEMRLGFEVNLDANSAWIDNVVLKRVNELPAADVVDVVFNVDLTAALDAGEYDPSIHEVGLVGSFNGWDTGNPFVMADQGAEEFTTNVTVEFFGFPATIEYKFILRDGDGNVTWDEPAELNENGNNNRLLTFDGSETDQTGDGTPDVILPIVDFELPDPDPTPVPPYDFGDLMNLNGSFTNTDLGVKGSGFESVQGWNLFIAGTTSTFEIIEDSQDGDNRSMKVAPVYLDEPDVWRTQVINEPINVQAGDRVRASVWLKADIEGTTAEFFLALPDAGNFVVRNNMEVAVPTVWTEFSFEYDIDDFDETIGMRAGVSFNYPENDGRAMFVDNMSLEKVEVQTTSYDVTFSVNTELMAASGLFDPNTQEVKIVGSFNGWDSGTGIIMNEDFENMYSATARVEAEFIPDTIYYKFILDNGNITWDEPLNVNPRGGNDRIIAIDGSETDNDGDDIADIDMGTVSFSDLGPEFIGSVADAVVTPDGDAVSFVGTVTRAFESFLFVQQDTAGIYTFNSSGFVYDAIQAGDVRPGDFVEVSALSGSFEGLQAFGEVDLLRVVYRDLELPAPILLTAEEFNNSGTRYNSELIRIENLRIDDATDFEGSTTYNVIEDPTGTALTMFVRGDNGSEVRGPIPDIFYYEGVAGFYGQNTPPNQLTPTYSGDIVGLVQELPIPQPPYAVGDTINYNGNFTLFNLGSIDQNIEGWFFDNVNGQSTYEIVDESVDGDNRAAKANIFYDNSGDIWKAQIVNEPIYPGAGDLIKASFYLKASIDGMKAEAFFGLPEAGGYADVAINSFELSTNWTYYEIEYMVSEFDAQVGLRFGVKMNYPENDQQTILLDDVQLIKQEVIPTEINFSVNTAVQQDLLNFDPNVQSVGVVGSFNGWDTGNPFILEAVNDSIYSGTPELLNFAIDDTVRYKFILKDEATGTFEWESPDPANPLTQGEFSDRIAVINDLELTTVQTDYFHDITRADQNFENYQITSILDARNSLNNSHLAIKGIVTRATSNFVYIQDETAGTMVYSRPAFSDVNSISFNQAVQNGEIGVGDELKIAGITFDYFGLHELLRIHAWEVVSTNNDLPEPQTVEINEYSNNGEEYESELVAVEYVRILDRVDSLFGGYIYEITNEDSSQIGWLSVQGSNNSEWANQPAPQGYFNLVGPVKEFFIPSLNTNIYAVSVHNENDIEELSSVEFDINSFAALVNTSSESSIEILSLGGNTIQGLEFTIQYDPTDVSISLGDQNGTLVEGLEVLSNDIGGELLVAFATNGLDNDITDIGTLMNLSIDYLSSGETEILITNILVNEEPVDDFKSIIIIVPRLCGDVSGDALVTSLDASLVLQNTVKIADIFPLVDLDSTAADVTGNGDISAFDASWILQKTVGVREDLGCISLPLKERNEEATANWILKNSEQGINEVELNLSNNEFEIYAVHLELSVKNGIEFSRIVNLPENWNMIANTIENTTHISLIGIQPLEVETLLLEFNTKVVGALPKLSAQLTLNENKVPQLDDLTLGEIPSEFSLNQNYPNPFNPSTSISYSLPELSSVDLTIYNMLGQKVASLVSQTQEAGSYTVTWNASSASSGVYIYRLSVGNQVFTKRMMLIK
jgi:hypothetical protein